MNNDSGGGPQTRRNAVESIVFRPEGEGGGDGRFVFRRRLKMGNRAFIFMLILLLLLLLLLVCPESTMWKCKRGWRRVGGGEGYKHTCSCSLSLSLSPLSDRKWLLQLVARKFPWEYRRLPIVFTSSSVTRGSLRDSLVFISNLPTSERRCR